MKDFLKEYWVWMVVPFVLVVGGLVLAYFLMNDAGASPFVYSLQ
jgi:hypothetical protein